MKSFVRHRSPFSGTSAGSNFAPALPVTQAASPQQANQIPPTKCAGFWAITTSVKRASVNATMDRCEGADFGHLCEVSETTCGAPAFVRNGEPRRRSRGEGW